MFNPGQGDPLGVYIKIIRDSSACYLSLKVETNRAWIMIEMAELQISQRTRSSKRGLDHEQMLSRLLYAGTIANFHTCSI